MFRLAKYYLLVSLYNKVKRNLFALLIAIVLILFVVYISADLLQTIASESRIMVLAVKWILLLGLMAVIGFNIREMVRVAGTAFSLKEEELKEKDPRKETILSKEKLQSRSELILQKYREQ